MSASLPDHAYVPGVTKRHPEGAFDALRETVWPGMSSREIATSHAFRDGLRYLDSGYYWEAHELLEAVWQVCAEGSSERFFVQALIQSANAALKRSMGQPKAARRLTDVARAQFLAARHLGGPSILGRDVDADMTRLLVSEAD